MMRYTKLVFVIFMLVPTLVNAALLHVTPPEPLKHVLPEQKQPIPFLMAMEVILPEGWSLYGDLKAVAFSVSWKNNDHWLDIISSISEKQGLTFQINWEDQKIHFLRDQNARSDELTPVAVNTVDRISSQNMFYAVNRTQTLRSVLETMGKNWQRRVVYDLDGLSIEKSNDYPISIAANNLSDVADQLNAAYGLTHAPIHLYGVDENILVVSAMEYKHPHQIRVFDVKEGTLLSNVTDLAGAFGWSVASESWPFNVHFQEQYAYPIIVLSLEDGLTKLLGRYPVQAQLLHNMKQVLFVSRPLPIQGEN